MTEDHPATSAADGTPATPAIVPGVEALSRRLDLPLSSLELRLWHLAVLALVADAALTIYGVGIGHVEGNPVMRLAMSSMGFAGVVALKSGALAVAVTCRAFLPRGYGPVVPATVAVPWLAAALGNVFVLLG